MKDKIAVFWFRRDLRIADNRGLFISLKSGYPVLPLFIFDTNITSELPENDSRISFIYDLLHQLNKDFKENKSGLLIIKGDPAEIWKQLINKYNIAEVYTNDDYEPYAIKRDHEIKNLLDSYAIPFKSFKDQVVFEKNEILKSDLKPYTVYTPYKNKWLSEFEKSDMIQYKSENHLNSLFKMENFFPSLSELGFVRSAIKVKPYKTSHLKDYEHFRNFPSMATSNLGPHLRFGTVSIRKVIAHTHNNSTFLNELIWREFFMQILFHFPEVVNKNFKNKYDLVHWRNNEEEFEKWCKGYTGYPIVDAGMRELVTTGYMHNRVRMITAGFLCKHLLIDWRWGEAFFAKHLLDYELSSNNGNWQWAAGTGCDAAPYFRIFNPNEQVKKFDKEHKYILKWVPEYGTKKYPSPIVEHKKSRERALKVYKQGLKIQIAGNHK